MYVIGQVIICAVTRFNMYLYSTHNLQDCTHKHMNAYHLPLTNLQYYYILLYMCVAQLRILLFIEYIYWGRHSAAVAKGVS